MEGSMTSTTTQKRGQLSPFPVTKKSMKYWRGRSFVISRPIDEPSKWWNQIRSATRWQLQPQIAQIETPIETQIDGNDTLKEPERTPASD